MGLLRSASVALSLLFVVVGSAVATTYTVPQFTIVCPPAPTGFNSQIRGYQYVGATLPTINATTGLGTVGSTSSFGVSSMTVGQASTAGPFSSSSPFIMMYGYWQNSNNTFFPFAWYIAADLSGVSNPNQNSIYRGGNATGANTTWTVVPGGTTVNSSGVPATAAGANSARITLTNSANQAVDYTVTCTAVSNGALLNTQVVRVPANATATVELDGSVPFNVSVSHTAWNQSIDGNGVTPVTVNDISGQVSNADYTKGTLTNTAPTLSNANTGSAPTSAPATTNTQTSTATTAATTADITKLATDIKAAMDRNTTQEQNNQTQAHNDATSGQDNDNKNAKSLLDALGNDGSTVGTGGGDGSGTGQPTTTAANLRTDAQQIGTDLTAIYDNMGFPSLTNATSSINFSWESTWGTITYNLDRFAAEVAVIRAILVLLLMFWFVIMMIKITRSAFA